MNPKEAYQNNESEVKIIPSVQVALIRQKNSESEIFLVKKNTKHFFSQWCLPGGKIDPGESPEVAACREVKEETGVIVKMINLHHLRNTKSTTNDTSTTYEYLIDVFVVVADDLSPYNASLQEHSEGKWFTFDQALELHASAIKKTKQEGVNITADKIPNAIAPKTLETINLLSHLDILAK